MYSNTEYLMGLSLLIVPFNQELYLFDKNVELN